MPAKTSILSPKCPFAIKKSLWEPSLTTEPVPAPTGRKRNLPNVNGENYVQIVLNADLWRRSGNTVWFMRAEHPYLRLPAISHREIIKVKSLIGGLNGKRNRWLLFSSGIFSVQRNGECSSRGKLTETGTKLGHLCFLLWLCVLRYILRSLGKIFLGAEFFPPDSYNTGEQIALW